MILRLFKDIFRELEVSDYKCEAFIKITRLFEDIFKEMEASIRNLRLFQRLRDFLEKCSIEFMFLR
jgi:hypothetical protein